MSLEPLPLVLADEQAAYQALLEGHRADPDDELLFADLCKARAKRDQAWLEHMHRLESRELSNPDDIASIDEWGHAG